MCCMITWSVTIVCFHHYQQRWVFAKIFTAVAVTLWALFVVGYCCCCHWSDLKAARPHLHSCSLKCEGSPCSTRSPRSHTSLAAIIRVIGIRWCWLNWKGMQTGQRGFSARENRLEESTRDSREEWRVEDGFTVTHSAPLALMKLAGFCRKHTNKLQGLMESECCHMLAVLEKWCQVWAKHSNYRSRIYKQQWVKVEIQTPHPTVAWTLGRAMHKHFIVRVKVPAGW